MVRITLLTSSIFIDRILEIYGMSECSGPHTVNTPSEQGVGSVGQNMKGCKTKIDMEINRFVMSKFIYALFLKKLC